MAPKKRKPRLALHKLGDNRNELTSRPRKLKGNFKESRDVREDRGTRQTKLGKPRC